MQFTTFKGVKKFIPYDGFYPAERTVQLAKQFSSSLGPFVQYEGTNASEKVAFRTMLKPFFAPGILYNTIKAGLAVDYPILQSDMTTNLDKPAANVRYRAKRAQTYTPTT
ncbi:MAG: hypothetical protein GKR77_06705, partial [Legionellales bacterium]|nr:hypothetical protein [Legionellales bacterium]